MPTQRPAFDEASRRRGRLLYVLMQCWTCHGLDGTGGGPAAATLVDDAGRRVVAYDFTEGEFRGGRRPIDIYRTFTTGVNGTPMPQYHEALMVGRDGYADLSQYDEALDSRGMAALRAYVSRMPTTEQIWETQRLEWAASARWDLVAYVVALARGGAEWRYLWSPLYRTR
jgi:mono/diheme cytochrome c family protein